MATHTHQGAAENQKAAVIQPRSLQRVRGKRQRVSFMALTITLVSDLPKSNFSGSTAAEARLLGIEEWVGK